MGVLDFTGPESFTPATASLTVAGVLGGEQVSHSVGYFSKGTCLLPSFYELAPSFAAVQEMRGVPLALQRPTDLHVVGVGTTGSNFGRYAWEFFGPLEDRTLVLPSILPIPTVTQLGGAYARLQATFQLPSEYQWTSFSYFFETRYASIEASVAWLRSHAATLAMPDFAGVQGWNPAWAPAAGGSGEWAVQSVGRSMPGANFCVDGYRFTIATRMGTY